MVADRPDARDAARLSEAEALAASLLTGARALETARERRRRARVAALISDPESRAFLLDLTDQVLRIRTRRRAAMRLSALVHAHPGVAMLSFFERMAIRAAALLAPFAPTPVVVLAGARLRHELAELVLPAARQPLRRHLRRRRAEGLRTNVNLLGEAVQGEDQAAARQKRVIELLERPEIECVSVKLSALYSQLDVLAYEHSLDATASRLAPILDAAAAHSPAKLVNLDMEEYRDLHLTVDVFKRLMAEPERVHLVAGLALQAYLPDSVAVLEDLCAFARERRDSGGAPIRVRLVKGANLAMERVEAELQGWVQAPFSSKEETDANYLRLLDIALDPANAGALRVGVASHNLFDVAWALTLDRETGAGRVEIEMLEGMAAPEARATARVAPSVLLYAPVVARSDFESAVAYLVRRFDENTSPVNFLAHLPSLEPTSASWESQRQRFRASVAARHLPPSPPRRPPMLGAPAQARSGHAQGPLFDNCANTDFSNAEDRRSVLRALDALKERHLDPVPAVVDGAPVDAPLTGIGIDPSSPERTWYRYVEADPDTVERAVATARRAAGAWAREPAAARAALLRRVADTMAAQRSETIALMVGDAGKLVREADIEVSEAIDGARYYAEQAELLEGLHGPAHFSPHGVIVVAPPWNFPYAIASGGVFAALAAGNAVILKPAPQTVLVGSSIVSQCHEAGIPADVVQFLPCADEGSGRRLITHDGVDAVVLTGAFDTARHFLAWRPELALHAETSGKNAIVVSAAADEEDAVRDLLRSAFSHAGQKCSAASLAILDAPVYDDPRFLERLRDATASLRVGSPWDVSTAVGPLIQPPSGALARALTSLGPGERWLVEPHQVGENPHLWSPGVKLGVAPGSELHLTECFGPVLGVLRARDLDHALELQNAPAYGLTAGISTLDGEEAARWQDRVSSGNLYVNRAITGAVIRRQPFGGWKRSTVGPGAKAGGPNYVASLGRWARRTEGVDLDAELRAARTLAAELLPGADPSGLHAERNLFRLRPLHHGALRLGADVTQRAVAVSLGVAKALGVAVEVSLDPASPLASLAADAVAKEITAERITVEDGEAFCSRIRALAPERVRVIGSARELMGTLLDEGLEVDTEPLVASGTYELLRWCKEQAVSTTLHRHGNVVVERTR